MSGDDHPLLSGDDARKLGHERIVFFSDAVFAIAITLIGLEIITQYERVPGLAGPETLVGLAKLDVEAMQHVYLGHFFGFAVLGLYWVAHYRIFRVVRSTSDLLILVNLLILAFVVFLPFPTWLWASNLVAPPAVRLYAGVLTILGLLFVALWLTAVRQGDLDPAVLQRRPPAYYPIRLLVSPACYLLAIAISFWSAEWAVIALAMVFFFNVSPLFDRFAFRAAPEACKAVDGASTRVRRFRQARSTEIPREGPPTDNGA